MLTRLYIRNYAIIPELDLSFQPGLSIITGETGAGKSILLGALGLALGKRADSRILTDEKSKCIVEAHFILKDENLKELFIREGLDFEEILICRREMSGNGKSRSFINDTPVQLKVLQEVTTHLIELHHQHDNLALQSRDYQVQVLDTLSGSSVLYKDYVSEYQKLIRLKQSLAAKQELEISSARKRDFLEFQFHELSSAQLKSGEISTLEESQKLLTHGEAIDNVLDQLQSALQHGSNSFDAQLLNLAKQLHGLKDVSLPLAAISDRVDALRLEVQDLALEAGRLEGLGQKDPAQLSRIESRLNQLYSLLKKYHAAQEIDLMTLHKSIQKELNDITSVGDQIESIQKEIKETLQQIIAAGDKLTKKRKDGARKIIPQMDMLLKDLGMPNGNFTIEVLPLAQPGPDGADDIQFLFSANKGMALQPLQSVASGGELSRLSLALKSLYAAQSALPTIIFDEIDTGISGEVAWRMGQLLRVLARGHQILMITHSPQIAAHASIQFHVSKVLAAGKDVSSVQLLTKETRIVEIAKMLSGDPPSKEALANAKSLVAAVK